MAYLGRDCGDKPSGWGDIRCLGCIPVSRRKFAYLSRLCHNGGWGGLGGGLLRNLQRWRWFWRKTSAASVIAFCPDLVCPYRSATHDRVESICPWWGGCAFSSYFAVGFFAIPADLPRCSEHSGFWNLHLGVLNIGHALLACRFLAPMMRLRRSVDEHPEGRTHLWRASARWTPPPLTVPLKRALTCHA